MTKINKVVLNNINNKSDDAKNNEMSNIDVTHKTTTGKGRKPKGGKLISKSSVTQSTEQTFENVILHLKCSLSDLEKYNENYNKKMSNPLLYTPNIPPEIQTYETTSIATPSLHYSALQSSKPLKQIDDNIVATSNTIEYDETNREYNNYAYLNCGSMLPTICSSCKKNMDANIDVKCNENICVLNASCDKDTTNEDKNDIINQKLMNLKVQLLKNKINDKKSDCFWCSHSFENPECYIPLFELDNVLCGYGSFCCPECAVAYLMKEPIDDTTKFDRYNLINQLYGKIYGYTKNIKPAPNPFYLLEKYYGNLTIEEYRKLLKSNHLLLIVEKPLTRIFPELHEETDNYDFVTNDVQYENSNNCKMVETQYKVKKNNDIKNTKSKISVIQEHFGLNA